MNYPNPPSPEITTKEKPAFKEITSELLRELESALNNATLWKEQVNLSLKGVKRILEVLLSLDFFKNANEIDSSLRNSIEWLSNTGERLKAKMKEYESFFNDFNTSMCANEQEATNILNANTQNIKSEVKKLENQLIETTTKLLTSYQIFLNNAKESATTQINTNKTQAIANINEAKTNANNEINEKQTQAINNINEAKENANNEITTNKTASLEALKQEKQQATSEITEAKKTAFNELLETLKPKFSGLFVGAYYIRNAIYIQGGWEQKVKDLSDYELEKSKKYERRVKF
nr:ATPase [Helicobacter pylori]